VSKTAAVAVLIIASHFSIVSFHPDRDPRRKGTWREGGRKKKGSTTIVSLQLPSLSTTGKEEGGPEGGEEEGLLRYPSPLILHPRTKAQKKKAFSLLRSPSRVGEGETLP